MSQSRYRPDTEIQRAFPGTERIQAHLHSLRTLESPRKDERTQEQDDTRQPNWIHGEEIHGRQPGKTALRNLCDKSGGRIRSLLFSSI